MTSNQVAYWSLQEQKRTNQAKESETNRHNLVSEKEAERSNRAREKNDRGRNLVSAASATMGAITSGLSTLGKLFV